MSKSNYTCNDYREEMILLSLQKRLTDENLSEKDKESILKDIEKLEREMEMD